MISLRLVGLTYTFGQEVTNYLDIHANRCEWTLQNTFYLCDVGQIVLTL